MSEELAPQSWIWDEKLQGFFPPTPYPQDGKHYDWNEDITGWSEVSPEEV